MPEKQLDAIFPPGKKVEVGPVYVWRVRVYGPDVTYPLDESYAQSVSLLLKSLLGDYVGFVSRVVRLEVSSGAPIQQRPAGRSSFAREGEEHHVLQHVPTVIQQG